MILRLFSLLWSSASRSQFWLPELAFKNSRSKQWMFTFGPYFGFWLDLWLFGVASRLPKVVTAIARFSCLGHILLFGRIFCFWRWRAGFQKWSQQLSGFHIWSIFWSSGGYFAFGDSTFLGILSNLRGK